MKYKRGINLENVMFNGALATGIIFDVTASHKELDLSKEDAKEFIEYEIGDRIGQLIIMPYPQIEFEETDELSETERGLGSYGSTGK